MFSYYIWLMKNWKEYPDIPHSLKFVHNFGSPLLICCDKMPKTYLVDKFANDK